MPQRGLQSQTLSWPPRSTRCSPMVNAFGRKESLAMDASWPWRVAQAVSCPGRPYRRAHSRYDKRQHPRNAPVVNFVCRIRERSMENWWKVVVILLVLWLVGVITAHTFGGAVSGLLIAAVVIAAIRVFQGKKPTT